MDDREDEETYEMMASLMVQLVALSVRRVEAMAVDRRVLAM